MPIKNNGSAEIGGVFSVVKNVDGTETQQEVKEVWNVARDAAGVETRQLIWQNEYILWPGGTVENLAVGHGVYGPFYTGVQASGSNYNSTVVYLPVDVAKLVSRTGQNHVVITGNSSGLGGGLYFGGLYVCTAAQLTNAQARYPYYTVGNGTNSANFLWMEGNVNGNLANGPFIRTWNLGQWVSYGTLYICLGCYIYGGSGNPYIEITSIKKPGN